MSTLATAVNNEQWALAAHVLVLATLQALNGEGAVPGSTKGGTRGGSRKRRRKGRNRRP